MKPRWLVLFVIVVLAYTARLSSQNSSMGSSGLDLDKLLNSAQTKSAADAAQRVDQIPYDNVIQPQYYRVGPGDVLSYLKLDATAMEESITVSPENLIFIPRLGAVSVLNKTLDQVRDTIISLQKQRTPNIAVYVGLKRPRQVYVTVRGNVVSPGVYALPAAMRVQTVLKMAMQFKSPPTDPATMRAAAQVLGQSDGSSDLSSVRQRSTLFPSYVMRNIVVKHSDRSSSLCDLHRAETTNSAIDDPYLREGDDIYVPADSPGSPSMTIAGGVAQPISTIYKKGDKISLLLKLGGRCTNLAHAPQAVLVRDNQKTPLQIDENCNLLSTDMDAQPGDMILVDQEIVGRTTKYGSVTVRGEVSHQGIFPIEQNTTRLKEVIEVAGGLTPDAYLPLAYVLRREPNDAPLISNEYVDRLKKMQYSNLLLEDTVRFAIDEISRKPLVACDFVKALGQGSSSDNIVLQDGDVVIIPRNPKSVFVYGQVRNAGYFEYVPGRSMESYIAMAGGMTSEADKGRERVIKGKTGVWLKAVETEVEAGDKIYVPHPPDEPLGQQVQRTSAYITIAITVVNVLISAVYLYINLRK